MKEIWGVLKERENAGFLRYLDFLKPAFKRESPGMMVWWFAGVTAAESSYLLG